MRYAPVPASGLVGTWPARPALCARNPSDGKRPRGRGCTTGSKLGGLQGADGGQGPGSEHPDLLALEHQSLTQRLNEVAGEVAVKARIVVGENTYVDVWDE